MRYLYYNKELGAVQFGIFLNYVGWGTVMPFEVIYLHDVRHFSLGVAGIVVGLVTGLAVVAAPVSGPIIDRSGPRAVAAAAMAALAVGYAGLALASRPVYALTAGAIAGVGNGALIPSQSTLLAALAPPELRHRVSGTSRVAANLGGGIGGALGGFVAAHGLNGFVVLFLGNAATYVIYGVILVAVVRDGARPEPLAGGYRVVLRDRPFLRLALTNVAIIGVGWGIFTWIVPAYAHAQLGVSTREIGFLLFANALAVVLLQLPVARLAEGRRRATTMMVAALAFVLASGLVLFASVVAPVAYPVVIASVVVVGAGECAHTTVLLPLVADLAPDGLRGRYMAAMGLSWWLGLALAPTIGAQLLSVSPHAAMAASAVVAACAALSARALDSRIAPGIRLTPRPVRI